MLKEASVEKGVLKGMHDILKEKEEEIQWNQIIHTRYHIVMGEVITSQEDRLLLTENLFIKTPFCVICHN